MARRKPGHSAFSPALPLFRGGENAPSLLIMQIVAVLVALALTFVIAAVVIGREVSRLIEQAPRPVFDLDEAVEWIAERLPFEVSAVLSYEEVRRILEGYLHELNREATSAVADLGPERSRGDEDEAEPAIDGQRSFGDLVIVGDDDAVSAIMATVGESGLDITEEHVRVVLEVQVAYLQAIGAAGPPQAI